MIAPEISAAVQYLNGLTEAIKDLKTGDTRLKPEETNEENQIRKELKYIALHDIRVRPLLHWSAVSTPTTFSTSQEWKGDFGPKKLREKRKAQEAAKEAADKEAKRGGGWFAADNHAAGWQDQD